MQQTVAASKAARWAVGTQTVAAGEYLTFRLGPEEYGIDILKVQEIRGYDSVTRIANTPEFIKGVINLRGTIVPIVDLRIKFRLGEVEYTPFTVVIILNVGGRTVGIVVDSVSEVVALPPEQIRPAPEFAGGVDTHYIVGLAARRTHADRNGHRTTDGKRRYGPGRSGYPLNGDNTTY